MKSKHLLALIPILGASVLLWGQPYSNNNLLATNPPIVTDLVWRNTNQYRIVIDTNPIVLFYTNREVFIVDSRWGPTNVVFSNDYRGTIQIGSNFMTGEDLRGLISGWQNWKEYLTNKAREFRPRSSGRLLSPP